VLNNKNGESALNGCVLMMQNANLLYVYKYATNSTYFITWQGDKRRLDKSNGRFQSKFLAFTAYVKLNG
jgi:hypothetical protein